MMRGVAALLLLAVAALPGRAEETWRSHRLAGTGIAAPVPPGFCVLDARNPADMARMRILTNHPLAPPPGDDTLFAARCDGTDTAWLAVMPRAPLGDAAQSGALRARYLDTLEQSLGAGGTAAPLGLDTAVEARDAVGFYLRITARPTRGPPECAAMGLTVVQGLEVVAALSRRCAPDAPLADDMAVVRAVTERLVRGPD